MFIKKQEPAERRPLTEGELERLNEEFTVEYTYKSGITTPDEEGLLRLEKHR